MILGGSACGILFREDTLGVGALWAGFRPSGVGIPPPPFMDAAWGWLHGKEGYSVGLFSQHMVTRVECLGHDISLGNRTKRLNQQIAELWGVWMAGKFACHPSCTDREKWWNDCATYGKQWLLKVPQHDR